VRLGRSGILAFFVGICISPLIAVFLYLALGESQNSRASRLIAEQIFIEDVRRENEGGPKAPKPPSNSEGVGGVLAGIFIIAVFLILVAVVRS